MSYLTKEKAAIAGEQQAAIQNKQNHYNNSKRKLQSNLDKSGLLSPIAVLDMLHIRYRPAGMWLTVYCPFHKGGKERNPSLSMNPKDGHYKCFSCGVKGGDVIAFYRAMTGAGFVEALKALGVRHG